MTDRKLTISFGAQHPAKITHVKQWTWAEFAKWLTREPPEAPAKDQVGWYCPAEFSRDWRDSDYFVARHAITLDFDHVGTDTAAGVELMLDGYASAIYSTWSHTPEKPRFRVVLPLSRPASYDEFQAVVRMIAAHIGIELIARESFVPSQMMFAPSRRAAGEHFARWQGGEWLDVDEWLAKYDDWRDHTSWPRRKEADGVHARESTTPPNEKKGIVGDFCRAFTVDQAIERFGLPYVPTATEGRYTYTAGSRPEGAVVYDGSLKLHSHHDSDPARGQSNAFDLVRLHKFGALDTDEDKAKPVTERPSYKAMCRLAAEQPELRAAVAQTDFADLGPLTDEEKIENGGPKALARRIVDVLNSPTAPSWLITDTIEHGVIALMAGERGSYKSFIALDWALRVATAGHTVYTISAEGGDFDRRADAWLRRFGNGVTAADIPLYVVERRLDLSSHDGVELIRQDCLRLGIRPKLFVLDTFSKLSGGLDENDNTAVKAFIGRLDKGLKRQDTGFGATVLLIAHTGHADKTRARGASALAADTDAEYIVSRTAGTNTVSVSRERFKSSPELSPLCYAPEVIDLGRRGPDGRAVTSLAMVPAEPPSTNKRKAPSGSNQKIVMQTLKMMAPGGESVEIADLVAGAVKQMPRDTSEGRDTRPQCARTAIRALVANDLLFMHGETRVSFTPARRLAEGDEWLDL